MTQIPPDIRPILKQRLLDTGLSDDVAETLLDFGRAAGTAMREDLPIPNWSLPWREPPPVGAPSLPLIRQHDQETVHIAVQGPYRCPTPCENDLCDFVCHEEHKLSSATWTHPVVGCTRAVRNTRRTVCGLDLAPPIGEPGETRQSQVKYRLANHTSGPLCETCKQLRSCPYLKGGICGFYQPCVQHAFCAELSTNANQGD